MALRAIFEIVRTHWSTSGADGPDLMFLLTSIRKPVRQGWSSCSQRTTSRDSTRLPPNSSPVVAPRRASAGIRKDPAIRTTSSPTGARLSRELLCTDRLWPMTFSPDSVTVPR